MTGLRDRFEELAEGTLVYGDLDRAMQQAARRRRTSLLAVGAAGVATVVAVAAGAQALSRATHDGLQPARPPEGGAVKPLEVGAVTPGRYQSVVHRLCDESDATCLANPNDLPAVHVTVPEGWDSAPEYQALFPMPGRDNESPSDPALLMGWTNEGVRVFSHPCHAEGARPDVAVGPTVDDFVTAVRARPALRVSPPRTVKLGSYSGRFMRLTGPSDISRCGEWRPWDPAPYLQGPGNIWDLWVMDVAGARVVIMAQYFPQTPAAIKAELRHMAESVRFEPRRSQAGTPTR